MARIGPALAIIAAATTRDERARAAAGARAVRARGATARPRARGAGRPKRALLMGALIILNTRNEQRTSDEMTRGFSAL